MKKIKKTYYKCNLEIRMLPVKKYGIILERLTWEILDFNICCSFLYSSKILPPVILKKLLIRISHFYHF